MSNLQSFSQPPPPAPAAIDSGVPGWILLDSTIYVRDLLNTTTATSSTQSGLAIQLSLVAAAPPRLSHFCAYSLTPAGEIPFDGEPEVLCSVGGLALVRVDLTGDDSSPHHFVYRAARGGPNGGPSLELLPDISLYSRAESLFEDLGFVTSHDSGGKNFVVAALSYGPVHGQYFLHTLGSEPGSVWSKKLLQVQVPDGLPRDSAVIYPTKVIALGGGLLGWVDLWNGVVICDVLDPGVATASFVPMPKLLPGNRDQYVHQSCARGIRDVAFSDGRIRCVEFEQLLQLRPPTRPPLPDPWDVDEFRDSELPNDRRAHEEEEDEYDVVGWRLITWHRELNWNGWRKGNKVHSDDLATTVSLLPLLGGGAASAVQVSLKDLRTAAPTLLGDDDVVYLVSMLDKRSKTAWILPVDTKKKCLGEAMPFPVESSLIYDPTFIPCELTRYLGAESDGAQKGKRNSSHVPPSRNISESKKQRPQLSQAELEKQQPVPRLLQHSSCNPSVRKRMSQK